MSYGTAVIRRSQHGVITLYHGRWRSLHGERRCEREWTQFISNCHDRHENLNMVSLLAVPRGLHGSLRMSDGWLGIEYGVNTFLAEHGGMPNRRYVNGALGSYLLCFIFWFTFYPISYYLLASANHVSCYITFTQWRRNTLSKQSFFFLSFLEGQAIDHKQCLLPSSVFLLSAFIHSLFFSALIMGFFLFTCLLFAPFLYFLLFYLLFRFLSYLP